MTWPVCLPHFKLLKLVSTDILPLAAMFTLKLCYLLKGELEPVHPYCPEGFLAVSLSHSRPMSG